MAPRLQGLYAVTPDTGDTPALVAAVEAALQGGVALMQYRNKVLDPPARSMQARAVLDACRLAGVPLVVNDDVELAATIGAEGVHLGRTDESVAAARLRLGKESIIGASCYNEFELARSAAGNGASYVAFGSFFPSSTKPHAVSASLQLLRDAKRTLHLPIVAIGGITPANATPLIDAGADLLAVVTALFDAPDIRLAAQQFSQLISIHHARQKQSAI